MPSALTLISDAAEVPAQPWVERRAVATDRELLRRFRAGDRAAFTEIVNRHQAHIHRQMSTLLGDSDEVRDVTQETFIAAWKKSATIDLVGDSLSAWLSATAWHIAQNRVRSEGRRPRASEAEFDRHVLDHESSTEELAEYRYLLDRIARAVAVMPEIDQQLYRLCIREGTAYDEAAEVLGIDKTAVRNRVSRIRSRLRDRFLADR